MNKFLYAYNTEHHKHFNEKSIDKPKICITNNENILKLFENNIINVEENNLLNNIVINYLDNNYKKDFLDKIKNNKELLFIDNINESLNYINETFINEFTYDVCLKNLNLSFNSVEILKNNKNINMSFLNLRPYSNFSFFDTTKRHSIINNIALTAKYALELNFKKILIIDLDVFHGIGTQNYFYNDNNVIYFSTHKSPGYPKNSGFMNEIGNEKGLGFNFNFPIDESFSAKKYIDIYEKELPKIIKWNKPDLIILSTNFNIIKGDIEIKSKINFNDFTTIIDLIHKETKDIKTLISFEGGNKLENVIKGTEYILNKYIL